MKHPKVFCIGFHKTGTTTLDSALTILGYRVTGPNRELADPLIKGNTEPALKLAEQFDACQDNPWPLLYKELDHRFPGSKFILTRRDPDAWIASMVNHFGGIAKPMRQWIYGDSFGAPLGNEETYLKRYKKHYEEVTTYFKDRPGDLLTFDLASGDGWKKLCGFLGSEIPDEPFPHSNKRSYSPVLRLLKKIGIR